MSDFLPYTTKDGERWGDVAQVCYGSQNVLYNGVQRSALGLIIEDNPDVPIYDILPAGTILQVRIIERVDVATNAEILPPWKQ